jgi:hypothetical protein
LLDPPDDDDEDQFTRDACRSSRQGGDGENRFGVVPRSGQPPRRVPIRPHRKQRRELGAARAVILGAGALHGSPLVEQIFV